MPRSFRLRLALMSSLLAGVALAGFAATAWWLIRDARIERMDADIRALVQREVLPRPRSAQRWSQLEADFAEKLSGGDTRRIAILAADGAGEILYRSNAAQTLDSEKMPWPPRPAGEEPPPRPPMNGEHLPPPARNPPRVVLSDWNIQGKAWRIGLATLPNAHLSVAVDLAAIDTGMVPVGRAFLVAVPLALVLIGLGAWLFAGQALRPVRRLTSTIRQVTAQGLDQRIPVSGVDKEFEQLLRVFNGMLERLELSFTQASRFSADAAHELKTPLAILQGQIERAIGQAEDGSAMQVTLSGILDEVRRLSTISRKLLLLSQADAGRLRLHCEAFDLSGALGDLIEDAHMLSPLLDIEGAIAPGLLIQADTALLRQVLHNLVSNAIKYNIPQGWIRITAKPGNQSVEVIVSNASNGIPAKDCERIFERFFRVDSAHNREVDGVGLGLSVAREIARAHHGDLVLKTAIAGEIHFALTLPRNV